MNDEVEFHLIVALSVEAKSDIGVVASALVKMRALCLAEPGCLRWDAYQVCEQPGKFFLVEKRETRRHWEEHGEMPAIKDIYAPTILPRIQCQVVPVIGDV